MIISIVLTTKYTYTKYFGSKVPRLNLKKQRKLYTNSDTDLTLKKVEKNICSVFFINFAKYFSIQNEKTNSKQI